VGTVIVSKGRMGENRYAPAFHGIDSRNIRLEDVTVHHALGMGYLFERCDTITLRRCGAYVRPGSDRVVSLIADATHFCHTKGAVLIEDCRFQHMLDDGVNVHGAYVVVDQVLNPRQVRVKLMHFQQLGFRFADPGDEVWLIHAPDPGRAAVRSVQAFEPLNERYSVVTFTEPVSDRLRPGDLLENKTWIPSFTMRGCTIKDHRARGVVLKTPRPIVIEDNDISSMMSGIFFRGESKFWFESGAVGDVLIRNNRFDYCAYSGLEHAVLTVTPRLGDGFDSGKAFDRDIRFEGNRIRTFGDRIVWADRVDGLTIAGNTIVQTKEHPEVHPGKPMIDLVNCRNVRIEGNTYEGDNPASVAADALSAGTLRIGENTGFTVRRP
jgi:polygalacturonase